MPRIVCCQLDPKWEDKPANHPHVRELLERAAPPVGSLIVLPEMFDTGFSMNVAAIHDGVEHAGETFLAEIARRYQSTVLGGLVNLAPDGRGYNEALAFGPAGDLLTRYRKLHPFAYAGEDRHYAPGAEILTFSWASFTVTPLICYDLRFPEAFRIAAGRGATLMAVIANFPTARVDHWRALLVARAIENQAYVVGVNRAGADPNVDYPGSSLVVDPEGRIVLDAGPEETIAACEIDPDLVTRQRTRYPFLRDLRRDLLPDREKGAG